MISVLLGALGASLVLLFFVTGVYVGRKISESSCHIESEKAPDPVATAEAERRRLVEDQNAFRVLMNYNADVAYGQVSAEDLTGSKGGDK